MFSGEYKIRFDDVDGAGIVYYPKFLGLCHKVFEDAFDKTGPLSYPKLIRERRLGFPTVHVDATFRAPLLYGDLTKVSLAVMRIGTSSLKCQYVVTRMRDKVDCFHGHVTTVCMDLNTHQSTPIPPDIRSFLDALHRK